MASADPLQAFLHLHVATDAEAVSNLPSLISTLSSADLDSSSHLAKWTNRVNALIHSREPGVRWAGIVLALRTARLSRSVLIGSAQGWVTIILPMLSRNESIAVWKAAIRLLAFIFTSTTNLAEFQRHVVIPNVPKFSSALLSLVENQADEELRVLCLDVLAVIVPLYPTLHRQMTSSLSTTFLNFLNGSPTFTPAVIVSSASKLHACLHTISGKVGSAALWRKSVDETIDFCSAALAALRTTYTTDDRIAPCQNDPIISIPLNLDRLCCGADLLCHLLREKVERPVTVPVQALVNLCVDILTVSREGELRNETDLLLRSMEAGAVSNVLETGCRLTSCLARCVQSRLVPHLTRILGVVVYHLEHPASVKEQLSLTRFLPVLLDSCIPPHEPLLCGRLIKAILPFIARLLSQDSTDGATSSIDAGSRKGKKRARGYEGDEIFKVGRSVLCEGTENADLALAALDALPYLLRVPNVPTYLQSLSSRLLLSLLLILPKISASSVAHDPTVKDEILRRVKCLCIEIASVSSTVLCQSLPLVIDAVTDGETSSDNVSPGSGSQNALLLDLMLHPRLPPLLRPLPPLDAIALRQSEEGTEERKLRESLGLQGPSDSSETNGEATGSAETGLRQGKQQTVRGEATLEPTHPAIRQPISPVIIPAVTIRPVAPVSIATECSRVLPPDIEPKTSQQQKATPEIEKLVAQPPPAQKEEQEKETPVVQPPQLAAPQSVQQQPSVTSEPMHMVVDQEDDDEDMEMPTLDPASPSDSEIE